MLYKKWLPINLLSIDLSLNCFSSTQRNTGDGTVQLSPLCTTKYKFKNLYRTDAFDAVKFDLKGN